MAESARELVRRLHMEEIERILRDPPPPPPPRPDPPTTIHYSELKENTSGYPESEAWNVYVREVGRLLAEGGEGKWVVIAEGRLIGVYDTQGEASRAIDANQFARPATMKQIREQEPIMRVPFWYEWYRRCQG